MSCWHLICCGLFLLRSTEQFIGGIILLKRVMLSMLSYSVHFASLPIFPMGLSTSIQKILYLSLWNLLHLAISTYFFISSCLSRLNVFQHVISYWSLLRSFNLTQYDLAHLSRLPMHLGLVFSDGTDGFPAENLVDLITWSASYGIPCVSVYDAHGFWKCRKSEVQLLMQKNSVSRSKTYKVPRISLVSECDNDVPLMTSLNSAHSKTIGTRVVFLTESDGKTNIANAAREICSEAAGRKLDVSALDQDLLGSYIRKSNGLPDPELVLKVGKLDSLSGYLPWHIRLTEIIYMPNHNAVSFHELRKALRIFSRVEQRVGR